MIDLLIVTKSKDPNGNNYSFTTQMDTSQDELVKSIFASPIFQLRWNSGIAYIATSEISICRISEIDDTK